jgi:hypothetical protein
VRTGPGTFDDERATAIATAVVIKLIEFARVQRLAELAKMEPLEVGETCVMPVLELVRVLCMNSGAQPPSQLELDELEQFHMHLYEARAVELYGPQLAAQRREVIRETFERLRLLARSYWHGRADALN